MAANREGETVWIRIDVALDEHRKTKRLMARQGITDPDLMVGKLWRFWRTVRLQAPDGNLVGWDDEDIAAAMGFPFIGDQARALVDDLVDIRWLDVVNDPVVETWDPQEAPPSHLECHDWMEHNGDHLKEAKRMRAARASKVGRVRRTSTERSPNGREKVAEKATRTPNVRGTQERSPNVPRTFPVRSRDVTRRDETGRDETGCAALQRAVTRAGIAEAVTATAAEMDAVDAYCGIIPGDDSEDANAQRRAIVGDPEWRSTTGTVLLPAAASAVLGESPSRDQVMGLVRGLTRKMAMDPEPADTPTPAAPAKRARAHIDPVWKLAQGAALPKPEAALLMQLTNRIYNAGVENVDLLKAVAQHYLDHRSVIRQPYAYYSPGGEGFEFIRTRWSSRLSVEEAQALARAERDWLSGKDPR
jgi:hypothetical protein